MKKLTRAARKKKATHKKGRQHDSASSIKSSSISIELSSPSPVITHSLKVPVRIAEPPNDNGDWTSHYDDDTQRTYYANKDTGRTTWTEHSSSLGNNVARSVTGSLLNPETSSSSNVWVRQYDPVSGQPYYENTLTGTTQWDRPIEDDFRDVGRESVEYFRNPLAKKDAPKPDDKSSQKQRPWGGGGFSNSNSNSNSGTALQQTSSAATMDGDLHDWNGSSRKSENAWNDNACGRHRRCCCEKNKNRDSYLSEFVGICGCCPSWCAWPCCAQRRWVRGCGFLCPLFIIVCISVWICMAVQLLSLLRCVQDDLNPCFNIDEIYVKDVVGPSLNVDVIVSLNNPGAYSWLSVGAVTSDVIEIDMGADAGTERKMGVLNEVHHFYQDGIDTGNTWLPSGKSTIIINASITYDSKQGAIAIGRLVGRNMEKMPLKLEVRSKIPVLLFLFPVPLYLEVPDTSDFQCERPALNVSSITGQYNLTGYLEGEAPNYNCGMSYKKRLAKSLHPKNKTGTFFREIGILDDNNENDGLAIQIGMELYLAMDEIIINFPSISVDVAWGSKEEIKKGPILRVDTLPKFLQHGWTLFTFNITIRRDENTRIVNDFNIFQLQHAMKDFLAVKEIKFQLVGSNTTAKPNNISMAQRIASEISPPIIINVQDKKNTTALNYDRLNPCVDKDDGGGGIALHEFFLRSFVKSSAHMYVNTTIAMPFFIWGHIPAISMDLNAPGVPGAHQRLLRIHTRRFHVPYVPFVSSFSDSSESNNPINSNNNNNRTNLWMVPIEVILDYTLDGFYRKLSGVPNITSMDLRLTGSSNINVVSEILYGGFEFQFNTLFYKEDRRKEAGCGDDLSEVYQRAGLDLNLDSWHNEVIAEFSFLLRMYPFQYAISTSRDIILEIKNETKWVATFVLQKFRLEPRGRGTHQDKLIGSANVTAFDEGASLRELVYDIANGRDVHITVTDGKGNAESYDVDLNGEDSTNEFGEDQIQIIFNPSNFIHGDANDEGVNKTTILTPKQLNLISMDTFGSIVDLPCLFQGTDCTVNKPTQFGAEAVLTVESVQALPIDLNCNLPDLSFDLSRSINYDSEEMTSTRDASWVLLANLVLDGGTYDLHSNTVGGTYITTERLYVPDVKEVLRTLELQEKVDNVTMKISTSPEGSTLLDAVLSEFIILVPLPKTDSSSSSSSSSSSGEEEIIASSLAKTTTRSMNIILDSTTEAITLDTTFDMAYGDAGGMTLTIASGHIDVWSSGVGEAVKGSTTVHPRDVLLHCERLANGTAAAATEGGHRVPECKAGGITWDELSMPSDSTGTLRMLTSLVSSDGRGKLLGQMVGEMVAGGSVSLECKGMTHMKSVPGRQGEVHSPISINVLMPRVVSSASNVTEILSEGEGQIVTDTIQSIRIGGVTTYGTMIDIPCLLGASQARCDDNNALAQQVSLTTTATFGTKSAVPSTMDIHIQLPSLSAVADVVLSNTPDVRKPFGKLSLDGFEFHAAKNDSIGITTTSVITDADVLRDVYIAMDRAEENMTFYIRGFNRTAHEGSGIGQPPTLLEKLLVHVEYNYEMTPAIYNPTSSSSSSSGSSDTTTKQKKSVMTVNANHDGTNSASFSIHYDLHADDIPSWLPPILCDGMEMSVNTGVTSGAGTSGTKAFSVNVVPFSVNATAGASLQTVISSTGATQLQAARSIVSALRNKDVVENIHVSGSIGQMTTGMNVKAIIGQTDFESVQTKISNATTFTLKTVNLVGGSAAGAALRIPCIMDTVCPGILHSADGVTSFTFFVEYALVIEGLPCQLSLSLTGLSLALDDNTHTKFIRLALPGTFAFDTRTAVTSTQPQSFTAILYIDSGTRARDVIRSIGGIDYRLHLHGDGSTSALSGLWQPSDSYLIEIGSDTVDPNAKESVPTWYYPLKSTNTWSIDSTTAAVASFSINNFPINWPLTFPLDLIAPTIEVVYEESGKAPVTIARATLKHLTTNAAAQDLHLLSNTTNQRHSIRLELLSDVANGPSYCRAGRTYVDTSKCATSWMMYYVLSQEPMNLRLNLQYTLPSTLSGGLANQIVTGSFSMHLFDDYWSSEWSRIQDAFSLNEWALIPPGPPIGSEPTFEFQATSSLTSLQAQIKLKLINPFNFPLTVERIRLLLGYDDVDGVGVGGSSWPVKTIVNSPSTHGNLLTTSHIDESMSNFVLTPNVARWSPNIGVPVGNMWENARRLYDEYVTKKRVCLHAVGGTANALLGTNFRFSIPFEMQKISVFGDNDCVTAPACDIFSDTNVANGHYRTVFDYTNMNSAAGSFTRRDSARTLCTFEV